MRFPPDFLDDIRARLPLSAVVARRVKLKKQGREWRGLSPFNAEKTPSFYVNDQKGFYHCFSSGKHGDQFSFIMETEGLSFPEAVERLAGEAGLKMPAVSAQASDASDKRRGLYDVLELAAQFFAENLQGRQGAAARGYVADRGLSDETIAEFRIGYASSSREALRQHLIAKGVSLEDMIAGGLLIHGEDIPVAYDRFRERVMFPIEDHRGRVVAFGGRALAADAPAKYLNSPETALFHKGSIVFNAARARKAAHQTGRLVVVEGYVDAIMLTQAGIGETVAPLGTALTEDQLGLCWRMADEPILCFDGDKAGLRAAYRAIELALPRISAEKTIRFALLPAGLDPDDLVRQRGRAAMEDVLNSARPLVDMLWERETAAIDITTPERRAGLERRVGALAASIADASVRRHYEDELRRRMRRLLGQDGESGQRAPRGSYRRTGQGQADWQAGRAGKGGRRRAPAEAGPIVVSEALRRSPLLRGQNSDWPQREALLMVGALNHPLLVSRHAEMFSQLEFSDAVLTRLQKALAAQVVNEGIDTSDALSSALTGLGFSRELQRLGVFMRQGGLWFVSVEADISDAETSWLQMAALHRRARNIHRELKLAEAAFAAEPNAENDRRLMSLWREFSLLDGAEALVEGYGELSGRVERNV